MLVGKERFETGLKQRRARMRFARPRVCAAGCEHLDAGMLLVTGDTGGVRFADSLVKHGASGRTLHQLDERGSKLARRFPSRQKHQPRIGTKLADPKRY